MFIAVDFDGTIVEHKFPAIGEPIKGALHWLKRFNEAGAKLILLTMRSDGAPRPDNMASVLQDAVAYCRRGGVEFFAVNDNPEQHSWTASPKVYAHHYIDDAAIGCPLVWPADHSVRPYVDWEVVGPWVMRLIKDEAAARSQGSKGKR